MTYKISVRAGTAAFIFSRDCLRSKSLEMSIPVVDFSVYSLNKEDATDEQLRTLSEELKKAFSQVGFVFLENSGITQEEVSPPEKVYRFDISSSEFRILVLAYFHRWSV